MAFGNRKTQSPEAEEAGGFVLRPIGPDRPPPLLEGLTRMKGMSWLDTVGARLAADQSSSPNRFKRSLDRVRRRTP